MSSKTDLMYEVTYNPQFIPKRSPKVKIKTVIVEGEETYVMKNHLTGMYFDIDEVSRSIWQLIDGRRTLNEIDEEVMKKWPDLEPDSTSEVILFFAEYGCLRSVFDPVPKKRIKVPSAFEVDVVLIEKSKTFLEWTHRLFRPLLKMPLLWGSLIFIVLCSILFARPFTVIFADASNFRILGSTVVGFFFYSFIVLGPAIAVHEIAHGLALVHYGGSPGEIGTGLFYFSPMFYIDATDSWTLRRRERIMVMMAGNISTLLIASIIVAVGYIFPYPASISQVLYMAAFFCFYATLMNLAPPFETDGYYVLADLVNIPTLRQESYGYVKRLFKKALGMQVDEEDSEVKKKKKTLIGFAILSVAWIIYTVFQTTLFTFYMAGDTFTALLTISSAITSSQVLSTTVVIVSVASILYFGMTLTGYGVIFISAIKKAFKPPLKFEAVHDRDLSMFFYLPTTDTSTVEDFKNQVKKKAENLTQNHKIAKVGPVLTATLRMGSTQLALTRMGIHLRKIERSFSSMYQSFLQENRESIFNQTDTAGAAKTKLATLLAKMGDEIADAGILEAKNVVDEIVERQRKTAIYLLNSSHGSIWTIELPPYLLDEVEKTLFPSFFVEDFAITDLYGETEDFKKRTVYGFDSLQKLSIQNRRYLRRALRNPEEHQVIYGFEPIKGRLLFIGRTEQVEKDIQLFAPLFVDQVWCGYLDNLLSETNLSLSTQRQPPTISKDEMETIADGELFTLNKNVSTLFNCSRILEDALDKSREFTNKVKNTIEDLSKHFEENKPFREGVLNAVFKINAENLTRLPNRLQKFEKESQRITTAIKPIAKRLQDESHRRKTLIKKRKMKLLYIYPLFALLSIILLWASNILENQLLRTLLITVTFAPQLLYGIILYSKWKHLHKPGRYPSHQFMNIQLYILAYAQAIYKFIATHDIMIPRKEKM